MENNNHFDQETMEKSVSAYFSSPQPRTDFVTELGSKLRLQYQHTQPARQEISTRRNGFWLRKFQARPVLLILTVFIAVLALTGIVYAFGRLGGFIPGFGFTSGSQPIYVLDQPVTQTQDGVTFRVDQAVSEAEKFWIKVQVENLPEEPEFSTALLRLPDGTQIERDFGQSQKDDDILMLIYTFAALPNPDAPLTLVIKDLLTEPVQIPITLRAIRKSEMLPAADLGDDPLTSPMEGGLQLSLDYLAPARDRTIFQVSVHFEQPNTWIIGRWTVTLQDENGAIYPLTEITPDTMDRNRTALYQTAPFTGQERLTLKLQNEIARNGKIQIMRDYYNQPGVFSFDPGENPQPGQTWELDQPVQVGDLTLRVIGAKSLSDKELAFEFAAHEGVTAVMLSADVDSIQNARSNPPVENQNFSGIIGFDEIPNQPFHVLISMVYMDISGNWQLDWMPPAMPTDAATQFFPTATQPLLPTPTLEAKIEDELYQRVKALSDQFDAPYQQGPGWVHVSKEQHSQVVEGQVLPPPYMKTDIWYEIDAAGYVLRSLYTDTTTDGSIIQQVAAIGNYSVNFTFGGGGYNNPVAYRPTLDQLSESFKHAEEDKSDIQGEEVDCLDGNRCLLVSVRNMFEHVLQLSGNEKAMSGTVFKVWIDLETGLQFKSETIYLYVDGSETVNSSNQVLKVERMDQAPQEIVGLLDRVVLP